MVSMKLWAKIASIGCAVIVSIKVIRSYKKLKKDRCCNSYLDSLRQNHTCYEEPNLGLQTSSAAFHQLRLASETVAEEKSLQLLQMMNNNCEFYNLLQPQKPISLSEGMIKKCAKDASLHDWAILCNNLVVQAIIINLPVRWFNQYLAIGYKYGYRFLHSFSFIFSSMVVDNIQTSAVLRNILRDHFYLIHMVIPEARVVFLVKSLRATSIIEKMEYNEMIDILDNLAKDDPDYTRRWNQALMTLLISQKSDRPQLPFPDGFAKWTAGWLLKTTSFYHPFDCLMGLSKVEQDQLIRECKELECNYSILPSHYLYTYYGGGELHTLAYYACKILEIQQIVLHKCEKEMLQPNVLWCIVCERKEKFELESEVIQSLETTRFVNNKLIQTKRTEQQNSLMQSVIFKNTFDSFPVIAETKAIHLVEKKNFSRYMARDSILSGDCWLVVSDYLF